MDFHLIQLIIGYSALLASIVGSTLVWHPKYGLYAYVPFWCYSNPVFILILLFGNFEIAKPLMVVTYAVMWWTAIYGFIFKKWLYKRYIKRMDRISINSSSKVIYIAGKLNADACGYIQNVRKMVIYAEKIRLLGCSIMVPCNDLIMGLIIGYYEYFHYTKNNLDLMERCDAVALVEGWETSEGTKKEIEVAESLGIPVLYNYNEVKAFMDVSDQ